MLTHIKLFIATVIILVPAYTTADLLDTYMRNTSFKDRTEASFKLGGPDLPYVDSGIGERKFIDISASLESQNRSCGLFSDMTLQLKNLINLESAIQGIKGITQGFLSGLPSTLMCYASQTLCDMYKFVRNMANFTGQMNQLSCQQYQQLGRDIGNTLRSQKVHECAMEKAASGTGDYRQYVDECEKIAEQLPLVIPGTTEKKEGGYKLSEAIAKGITDDPELQKSLTKLLGDIKFTAAGTKVTETSRLAEEEVLSNYTKKYYEATRDTIESYIQTGYMPDVNTLRTISTPGYAITPYIVQQIAYMDKNTREHFYSQYATVAGMHATLLKIEELMDALEIAKNMDTHETTQRVKEEQIKKLQRKYDILERRLRLQKDYLNPMFLAVMQYRQPPSYPPATKGEIYQTVPPPVYKGN